MLKYFKIWAIRRKKYTFAKNFMKQSIKHLTDMRYILFSIIFTFAVSASFAQTEANKEQKPENQNAPEISFEKTVHDYGMVVQGSYGTCEFKFTNTGKEPLILSKPVSSCGCTVADYPKEPILPGKSGVIPVQYNTKIIGPINKMVTVYSNATTNRVVLSIKGQVVAKPESTVPEKNTTGTDAIPVNK
jgi:hypothetical protein